MFLHGIYAEMMLHELQLFFWLEENPHKNKESQESVKRVMEAIYCELENKKGHSHANKWKNKYVIYSIYSLHSVISAVFSLSTSYKWQITTEIESSLHSSRKNKRKAMSWAFFKKNLNGKSVKTHLPHFFVPFLWCHHI